jgi:Ca2+-binding EF-hand superfamily protein
MTLCHQSETNILLSFLTSTPPPLPPSPPHPLASRDRTGKVSVEDFAAIVRGMGYFVSDSELNDAVNEIAVNDDGLISFPAFWEVMEEHSFPILPPPQNIASYFDVIDKESQGTVAAVDLVQLLMNYGEKMTAEDVTHLIQELEMEDGDNNLSITKFIQHMYSTSNLGSGVL